ncbi:hypothetical protein B0F90DRAFT_1808848 [Multifurca ochricompacta]|uniref:DASH complex subunit DUO1 n=1 Tax=Multifurca ochricompacta TaxID=376703 RepID=A0AAD4M8P8_9AGAM|nr:hypothetical protein B0F90DRAFT_1808848 [Multifurca ochricompacta]
MDSFDSTVLPSGGSRLLSQSPQFSFSFSSTSPNSHTGPGGDDLSLSELELHPNNQLPERQPQTRHNQKTTRPSIAQALGLGTSVDHSYDDDITYTLGPLGEAEEHEDENEDSAAAADVTVRVGGEDPDRTRLAAQSREEKLQNDIFVLRQLNGAFAVYNDALRETRTGTERIARQLEQTDALLNKYINILSKSEQVTRLIFDERWMGAEADEAQLEAEERAREEVRRREEEERLRAAQREQERREREEQELAMRDEAERLEREKRDKMTTRTISGVRGVRGTRASMRAGAATRGTLRAGMSWLSLGPWLLNRAS